MQPTTRNFDKPSVNRLEMTRRAFNLTQLLMDLRRWHTLAEIHDRLCQRHGTTQSCRTTRRDLNVLIECGIVERRTVPTLAGIRAAWVYALTIRGEQFSERLEGTQYER